ncbi:uncharacterized protein [Pyrus communis]|uniref:uncharacterized protein n=1 Tax=Pyrus communis TaxID=23211 RepID=UPI0035C0793F
MRGHVFECLLRHVQQVNPYFRPHQKVIVALRMMVYGSPTDLMDEAYSMSKSTCLDNLVEFCDTIVQLYKDEYLCEPNQEDLDCFLHNSEDHGFPGMIGSLDCMHWDWKNCPTGWQRGFCRWLRKPTTNCCVRGGYLV